MNDAADGVAVLAMCKVQHTSILEERRRRILEGLFGECVTLFEFNTVLCFKLST
jgi:hypothetical protein